MRCLVCDTEIEWLGFGGLEGVVAQCPRYPRCFFFFNESLLSEEFLLDIVIEREERIRKELIPELTPSLRSKYLPKDGYLDVELSMISIDPKDARRITSFGSRIEFSVDGEITKEEIETLSRKWSMTIQVILKELEYKGRKFKRKVI